MDRLKIYAFTRANAMQEHEFTDDVAICIAKSKREAIKKFKRMYSEIQQDEVNEVWFNYEDIAILTDY